MRIRKNDMVVLTKAITGAKQVDGRALGKEARGTVARVLRILPKSNRVIVEGVNYVYKHVRPNQQRPQGGRVPKEAAVHMSNVMLYCPKCQKPCRVRNHIIKKTAASGKTHREVMRVCTRCGESVGRS